MIPPPGRGNRCTVQNLPFAWCVFEAPYLSFHSTFIFSPPFSSPLPPTNHCTLNYLTSHRRPCNVLREGEKQGLHSRSLVESQAPRSFVSVGFKEVYVSYRVDLESAEPCTATVTPPSPLPFAGAPPAYGVAFLPVAQPRASGHATFVVF